MKPQVFRANEEDPMPVRKPFVKSVEVCGFRNKKFHLFQNRYTYVYIYIYVSIYVYVYIYIYLMYMCIYIYIHMPFYGHVYI